MSYEDNYFVAGKTLGWKRCVICFKEHPGFHDGIDPAIAYPEHEDDCPLQAEKVAPFEAGYTVDELARCNSGHLTPRTHWECPVCVAQQLRKLREELEAERARSEHYYNLAMWADRSWRSRFINKLKRLRGGGDGKR